MEKKQKKNVSFIFITSISNVNIYIRAVKQMQSFEDFAMELQADRGTNRSKPRVKKNFRYFQFQLKKNYNPISG